jgi:hypothetical protein
LSYPNAQASHDAEEPSPDRRLAKWNAIAGQVAMDKGKLWEIYGRWNMSGVVDRLDDATRTHKLLAGQQGT